MKSNFKEFKEKFSIPSSYEDDFYNFLRMRNKKLPLYIGALNKNIVSYSDYIIQTNARKIKGFFSIKNESEFAFVDEKNPEISFEYLSFHHIENNEIKFTFTINFLEMLAYESFRLEKSALFVTSKELERFLSEYKKTSETKVKNEHFTNQNRKKSGRPQHPLKSEIISIAQATFSAYNGDITRQNLAEELAEYLNEKYRNHIKQRKFSAISEETIRNYLKELNIGNRKGKSKNLDFINITTP